MADTNELLPLPDGVSGLLQILRDVFGPGDSETAEADIRAYARANLATRDAEIARLRAEVEDARRAVWIAAKHRGPLMMPAHLIRTFNPQKAQLKTYSDVEGNYYIDAARGGEVG